MVVGTSTTHCRLCDTHLNAARSATSVLPKPTSPHSSRSIGTGRSISALISSVHRSWSSVSSNSNRRSKSYCHSPSGSNAKPGVAIRLAYSAISSRAISRTADRTRDLVFCHSWPPRRCSLTRTSSLVPIYLDTRSSWVTGTYKVSPLSYRSLMQSLTTPCISSCWIPS